MGLQSPDVEPMVGRAPRALQIAIHGVKLPDDLASRPWLKATYDEPEFVVRNLWRLYGGWYDGNPASLKPAPERALVQEIAALAGGARRLAARAEHWVKEGDLRLACHFAEMAALAEPDDETVRSIRAAIYEARSEAETSLMARSIFADVAAGNAVTSTCRPPTGHPSTDHPG